MFALRIVGDAWYCGSTGAGPISANSLGDAMHYDTRAEAESDLLLFVTRHPRYIGKVVVKPIRAVRVQERRARVVEWKERVRGGKKTRVPAKTVIDCEWAVRYVVKR